jgi:hypothetical protein
VNGEKKLKECNTHYCDFHCCSGNVCFVDRYNRTYPEFDEYMRAEACVIGTQWYREALETLRGDKKE